MESLISDVSEISPVCSNRLREPRLTPDFMESFSCESFRLFRMEMRLCAMLFEISGGVFCVKLIIANILSKIGLNVNNWIIY